MQLTTPVVGAVFAVSAILSSCLGDPGTDSEQAFTNSDAPVGAVIAAVGEACTTNDNCTGGDVCVGGFCVPVPTDCVVDIQGPNDPSGDGQKDLTQFCVAVGDGSPYELHTKWNWDEQNNNPGSDACALFDTDDDGLINNAVCVTVDDEAVLVQTRVFLCNNTRPENCGGGNQNEIMGPLNTVCEVSLKNDDPFTAGDDYDVDTEALCWIDVDDFGATGARLVDACSYPSASVESSASDCILFTACSADTDCDDGNDCTDDVCNTDVGACVRTPDSTNTCNLDDDLCTLDVCSSLGFCEATGNEVLCPPGGECIGAGVCDPNDGICKGGGPLDAGTACGDDTDTDCDNADTCDGSGTCLDNFEPADTVCRTGSDDDCDPDELCTGTSPDCPADIFDPGTLVCNPGSGDVCDPDELCPGVAGGACPADSFDDGSTVCNPGSGDLCDPDELCPGTADGACPVDMVANPNTLCRVGSGDVCDPNELCTGVPGVMCPSDTVTPTGIICNPGSGDLCDPHERCTGIPGTMCPSDTVAPTGTVCNPGSGDVCDPNELCTGVADQACPADSFDDGSTVCNPGSGDVCDPDETCPGTADGACPADSFDDGSTVCNPGSGDVCDPDETCPGTADGACPADSFDDGSTVCNPGSGDVCDPDETCPGTADGACPADSFDDGSTVCNPGSGDVCDPDETCPGTADGACPADSFDDGSTVCNPGSGDVCDPDETCPGTADGACPADSFDDGSTVCNPGSGDVCDPDETCPGTADGACPADSFDDGSTVCNPGSGDVCDPDETCPGTADGACPADSFDDGSTVCNPGSGDVCDPDETCPGSADAACPADSFDDGSTVCNPGSGDVCDPDETCPGTAGGACPADTVASAGTLCREGSGDVCDPDELCTGSADAACPADSFDDGSTVCNPGSGDVCDPDETCPGTAGGACPADSFDDGSTVCNVSAGVCDPAELCPGVADGTCPDDEKSTDLCRAAVDLCDVDEFCDGTNDDCPGNMFADVDTPCGSDADTACTDPDTCDGLGMCLTNNQRCGGVTDSSLCFFDVQPDKGMCTESGAACLFDAACGTDPDVTCADGYCHDADGDNLLIACNDGCADAGDFCEQTGQFRLLFTPDVQNYPASKLPASNPGQTFYNLITDELTYVTISIPYPYVTVGGMPLHVYEDDIVVGACVGSDGSTGEQCTSDEDCDSGICDANCFAPDEALQGFDVRLTLDNWATGTGDSGDGWELVCDQVVGPAGSGVCELSFDVGDTQSGKAYVNLHLDYGLKGVNNVDANPVGGVCTGDGETTCVDDAECDMAMLGTCQFIDRYDRAAGPSSTLFAETGYDALVNTDGGDGPLGIADCTDYLFSHDDGIQPFEDNVQNLNAFKGIAGSFGRCTNENNGKPCREGLVVELMNNKTGEIVQTGWTDQDGYWATVYKHRGKPTPYTVLIWEDTCGFMGQEIELQGNGWANVDFDSALCISTAEYGKGRNKN